MACAHTRNPHGPGPLTFGAAACTACCWFAAQEGEYHVTVDIISYTLFAIIIQCPLLERSLLSIPGTLHANTGQQGLLGRPDLHIAAAGVAAHIGVVRLGQVPVERGGIELRARHTRPVSSALQATAHPNLRQEHLHAHPTHRRQPEVHTKAGQAIKAALTDNPSLSRTLTHHQKLFCLHDTQAASTLH